MRCKGAILGSLLFEEMSCCGYDPQRRQFACPVKINQTIGFGVAPLPGSREHVLHGSADTTGVLVPVGHDSVHLADAIGNQSESALINKPLTGEPPVDSLSYYGFQSNLLQQSLADR